MPMSLFSRASSPVMRCCRRPRGDAVSVCSSGHGHPTATLPQSGARETQRRGTWHWAVGPEFKRLCAFALSAEPVLLPGLLEFAERSADSLGGGEILARSSGLRLGIPARGPGQAERSRALGEQRRVRQSCSFSVFHPLTPSLHSPNQFGMTQGRSYGQALLLAGWRRAHPT